MDTDLIAEAKEMGRRAGTTGYSLKVNPYTPHTVYWLEWRFAWVRASEARLGQSKPRVDPTPSAANLFGG